MRPEDEFFDVIEEFEEGSSEGYFPLDFPRIPDPDSVPVLDRFCCVCGALLAEDWEYGDCPECRYWVEMMFPDLGAENLEYQRYLRSLEPESEQDSEPDSEPDDEPFHPNFI